MQKKIKLIAQAYDKNTLGEMVPTETASTVWADIQSASGTAWSEAGVLGIKADLTAYMPVVNYGGQKVADIDGVRYAVYRTYRTDADEVQLYLQEEVGA